MVGVALHQSYERTEQQLDAYSVEYASAAKDALAAEERLSQQVLVAQADLNAPTMISADVAAEQLAAEISKATTLLEAVDVPEEANFEAYKPAQETIRDVRKYTSEVTKASSSLTQAHREYLSAVRPRVGARLMGGR